MGGERFLKRAEYTIILELPGKPASSVRITIDTAKPPSPGLARGGIAIDPPGEINSASELP
jgi:hypothetical protein